MNGPLAQIAALTCHGNASIRGENVPHFFPANSTCQFCDFIHFVKVRKAFIGKSKEVEIAGNPDDWIRMLRTERAKGIRLMRQPENRQGFSDRMLAGLVGGGGTWMMEVLKENGRSEYWASQWKVWNQNAPERRIWRVSYGLVKQVATRPYSGRSLEAVKRDFRVCLEAIHGFSERVGCTGFSKCFADALTALDNPAADIGYHKDLASPNLLSADALSMLKASMSAWVFGGMGSWNDLGFQGDTQQEYEKVSEDLFRVLNEAIEVSATSTGPD